MAIIVGPLSQVAHVVRSRAPSHVVSLLDPETPFPTAPRAANARHLQVGVHDITSHFDGWHAPQETHVRDILRFVEDWDRAQPMLVHCYAGISRSTATAFITACLHNPRADEGEIAWTLRRASHIAWPNKLLVELADAEMGRSGRMVRAIAAIGEGKSWSDVGENEIFEIPSVFAAKD
jgi:predicted protein tyrosine phosphatase